MGVPYVYDVKRYGATGAYADDATTAVQAAFAAAAAASRPGTVYFPAGAYKITDTVHVGKDVNIAGMGTSKRGTNIAPTAIYFEPASAKSLFVLDYTIGTDPYRYGGVYQNLEIVGKTNAEALFDLQKGAYVRIRDCNLRGSTTTDLPENLIKINDGMLCTFQNLQLSNASVALFEVTRTSAATTQLHFYSVYCTGTTTPIGFKAAASSAYMYMHNVEVESVLAAYSVGNDNYIKQFGCVNINLQNGFVFGTGCGIELYGTTTSNCSVACMSGTGSTIRRYGGSLSTTGAGVLYTDQPGNWVINADEQGAPIAIADGDTAITAANLQQRILTMASSTSGRAPTVPTGTAVDGILPIGGCIDWTFINTGNQTVTISAAADHTLVGGMALTAGTQGMFRTRCTAANTAITYRLA